MITDESWRVLSPLSREQDGFFWGHLANLDATHKCLGLDMTARVKPPVCSALGFSKRRDVPRVTLIPAIHRHRHPSTVLRGVWPIIINPVNRQTVAASLFGPLKKRDRCKPFGANGYSATAVSVEVIRLRVEAPLDYRGPYRIGVAFSAAFGILPVDGNEFRMNIGGLAPTRRRIGKELKYSDEARCPANANAGETDHVVCAPAGSKFRPNKITNYRPVTELVANLDREMLRHARIIAEDTTGN